MPDLSHLWQRFVLASTLVFGLAIGIAATIFGYSNTGTVTVGFALWHLEGIPLWSVAIVPVALALVIGTLYHWWNSLHHFTEHMRHRRRVRDLESEVAALKEHMDHLLEMPDHGATPKPAPVPSEAELEAVEAEPEPKPGEVEPVLAETASANGADKGSRPKSSKKPAAIAADGENGAPTPETGEAANS